MVKMAGVKALILIALILYPMVCYDTLLTHAIHTPTLHLIGASDKWVNLSVRIGVFDIVRVDIRVLESFSAPYSIIAYYEFYTTAIETLLGLKPSIAKIAVTITATWGVWAYREYIVESVGFRGSLILSEIPGVTLNPKSRCHLYIDKLILSLSDGFRVLGYEFNLGAFLRARGIPSFWFIPGIRYAMIRLELVSLSDSWALYRVLRGGLSLASLYVTAYPTFKNASIVVIDYRVSEVRVADLPNLTVNLKISVNNTEIHVSRELRPGSSLHIPAHIPIKETIIILKEITIKPTFLGFTPITYNVSKDVGLITVRITELNVIRYPLKVIKVESLGEGWVAVYLGTNLTASYKVATVSYTPYVGFQEPLTIKVAELKNIFNHTIVYKVLMAFPQEGNSKGLITIRRGDPGRPPVVLEADIESNIIGSSGFKIRSFNVTPTVLDKKSFISLEIFNLKRKLTLGYYRDWERSLIEERIVMLERELRIAPIDSKIIIIELPEPLPIKISENLIVRFTLTLKASEPSKPIEIRVVPEFIIRGPSPYSGRYFWWFNTTTTGYNVLRVDEIQEYNLTIILSYTIEELLEYGVALDNLLRRIIIEVNNVRDIVIMKANGHIVEFTVPHIDYMIITSDLGLKVPIVPAPLISPLTLMILVLTFILIATITVMRLRSHL
jgi:hypothetical protein